MKACLREKVFPLPKFLFRMTIPLLLMTLLVKGFSTAKGELVRAILYPKPVKIKLHTQLIKCMVMFFILGIPALIYTGITGVKLQAYSFDIVLFLLNVITFFVPPALPAVLTSINEQAQRRLKKEGIFCLNTRFINVAGTLDAVCFDKTGTLTENSLDISIILPVTERNFGSVLKHFGNSSTFLQKACACCHSLSNIKGKLTGYDLDVKMFKETGWELHDSCNTETIPFEFIPSRFVCSNSFDKHQKIEEAIALVKEFPFESTFKRMSVVTKSNQSRFFNVYLKGAPEVVTSLCRKETVPENIEDVLKFYSSQGFRIIGFASKEINQEVSLEEVLKLRREQIEKDMKFLGLLVFENKLKKETVPALNILKEANIRMIMVTGDNILTAITVSRQSGVVEKNQPVIIVEAVTMPDISSNSSDRKLRISYKYASNPTSTAESTGTNQTARITLSIEYTFAMDGETFHLLRVHDQTLLETLTLKCAVFARMSPEHKLYLIEVLQNLGYQVGMCGDGANDCGALKSANIGVSLSMAEASVAAPFTALKQDVGCISTLIREGRATLISTFDAFRYMVCYTFMFLITILILLWDGQRPSDGAYVIIDVILNLSPPFLLGATGAYHGLAKTQPLRSILSFIPLFSILSFLLIQTCVLSLAYEYCQKQSWYEPFTFQKETAHTPDASYSGTTVLMMNMMTYITAAFIFPTGKPYRAGFFSNKPYTLIVMIQFLLVSFVFIYPPSFFLNYLNFKDHPTIKYNLSLYGMSLSGMLFCFLWEKYLIQWLLVKFVMPAFVKKKGATKKYEKLLKEYFEEDWLPEVRSADDSCCQQSLNKDNMLMKNL